MRAHPQISRLSDWHKVKQTHHRGKRVLVTAEKQVPFGLICSVGGKKKYPAILRKYEIS